MTKLDSKNSLSNLTTISISGTKSSPRLLVLVPNVELDLPTVTRRVWELANATGSHVQFLGLYSDAAQEPSLRRELIAMSAMVKDAKVSTEGKTIFGKDWVEVVKTHFQPGDLVVCFAEQYIGSSNKLLSETLHSDLNMPVYVLSGLLPRKDSYSNWLSQLILWAGSIAILIGFFVLQVKMTDFTKSATHTLFLILSIPAEIWAIWVWNSFIG